MDEFGALVPAPYLRGYDLQGFGLCLSSGALGGTKAETSFSHFPALRDSAMEIVMLLLVTLALTFITGCASTHAQVTAAAASHFPGDAFMTHRAVLSFPGHREFALTGYLAISQARGLRLVISEQFGGELADLLVKPDGSLHLIKAGPMLKEEWIEKYVAADLKCIFGRSEKNCPVKIMSPNHFVVKRHIYRLDLRIVETRPGPQPDKLFEPSAQ